MEELGITRRTAVAPLGAMSGSSAAGRLRLLGWRARRGWFGRSGMWTLALVPPRPIDARTVLRPREPALAGPPALSRVTRIDLDLAFRSPGEAALLRAARSAGVIARVSFKIGAVLMGASLGVVLMLPIVPVLLALVGLAALGIAAAAEVVSLLAALPAQTTRAWRLRRWSSAPTSSRPVDGDRVLVRGRVVSLQTVSTLDGRRAVFQRVRATRRGHGAELQRGTDFLLDDGSGTPTRVGVSHALFLDRPARVFGWWLTPPTEVLPLVPGGLNPIDLEEAALHEGDEVEVTGRAETIVDPTFGERLERATPLVRVLHGTPDEPLLVRSVL